MNIKTWIQTSRCVPLYMLKFIALQVSWREFRDQRWGYIENVKQWWRFHQNYSPREQRHEQYSQQHFGVSPQNYFAGFELRRDFERSRPSAKRFLQLCQTSFVFRDSSVTLQSFQQCYSRQPGVLQSARHLSPNVDMAWASLGWFPCTSWLLSFAATVLSLLAHVSIRPMLGSDAAPLCAPFTFQKRSSYFTLQKKTARGLFCHRKPPNYFFPSFKIQSHRQHVYEALGASILFKSHVMTGLNFLYQSSV